MRHLKRPALLGLLLLACLLLAGCRMDSTMEELFTLPRLPTEYTTLSRQLDQLLSEGYEYMAPTSGRNIQSLQMVDIDGDGRDEALAFFRLNNGEKPLKIYVFHSREDSYELTSIIESSGTAIDSIYYEDLTGDGRKELIVGWKISADVQTVTVYDMRPGPVQLMQSNYTHLSFQELNGDGIPSLLLLRTNSDNQPVAEFCSWQEGSLSVSHRCALSSTMAELNQGSVVTGKLDQDTPAVFITGINSQGIAVTDILVWQEDAGLVNAALDRSTGLSAATAPYRQLTPQDINGDGITELPRPDSSVSDTKQADVVFWEQYRPDGLATVERTYHCLSGGWYFILPEDWTGEVTALASDAGIGETQVTLSVQGEKALSICALTGENRERRALRGNRVVLKRRTGTIYAAETLSEIYSLDEETLRQNFNLIVHSWDAN